MKKIILFPFLFVIFCIFLNKNIPDSTHKYQDIDSKAYINNALNFYNYNSFKDPVNPGATPYYSLGYAFFIGLTYKAFGVNNLFVVLLQILLALLTAFLIYRTTRYLFGTQIALVAFLLSCLNLGFIVFSQFMLTEILLAFFLTLFLERFTLFCVQKNIWSLFQSGLFLGLSVAIKPAAIYFIFFLLLFLLFFVKTFSKKIWAILCFAVAFYIPVCSYMLFNRVQFGEFCVAPLANENLYFYLFPKVLAVKNNTDYSTEVKNVASLLSGEKIYSKSWEKIKESFLDNFKNDPVIFIKIWMLNVVKTFAGLFTTNLKVLLEPNLRGGDISFFKTSGNLLQRTWSYIFGGTNSFGVKIIGITESLYTLLRYFLILCALIFLMLKKRWDILFLFIFYIFYFAMITGHDGCARFRMMFEPALIILTALGFVVMFLKKFREEIFEI
jgi:4-amino-4-deoxy-L-arabinose transferase-like glycosyltransferase